MTNSLVFSTCSALAAGLMFALPFSANVHAGECKNPNALGVSRVITVDTKGGPRFGNVQYRNKEQELLKDGEVILTFDDGPLRRHTKAVLAALDAHCTKATFFAVGRMAIADADMLRKVADAGHSIGHHTWSHKNQKQRSFNNAVAEFELGVSAVTLATGRPTVPFFRFPYLADPFRMKAYLAERNFAIFSIDVDSYDFRTRSGNTMLRNVMSQLKRRRKGIILFHDIQHSTAKGIRSVLDTLKAKGFKIVHLVAKAPAVTLPEYDKEAAVLLEKRRYMVSARPIKTAFNFNARGLPASAPMMVEKRLRPAGSTATASQVRRPHQRSTAASKPSVKTAPVANANANKLPRWQRRVLGIIE